MSDPLLTRRQTVTAGAAALGLVAAGGPAHARPQPVEPGRGLDGPASGVPTPLAHWQFGESAAPFASSVAGIAPLLQAPGSSVTRVSTPFGGGVEFDGVTDRLCIGAADVGPLNVATTTGAVTVSAWVYSTDTDNAIIAGVWQESRGDPRRSYALFDDLPMYGGDDAVCMEVSHTGDATEGYPFSIDYAVEPRRIARGRWQLQVGTFDGAQAVAYLNGYATAFPSYTDPQGATYAKNPYAFSDTLYAEPTEFTVGAVVRDGSLINLHKGRLARLRVWDRALTATEVRKLWDAERWRVA